MDTLACTAPEIMLARIGAETRQIRIGSGGIMLPHYTAAEGGGGLPHPARALSRPSRSRHRSRARRRPDGGAGAQARPQHQDARRLSRSGQRAAGLPRQRLSRAASLRPHSRLAADARRPRRLDAGLEHVECRRLRPSSVCPMPSRTSSAASPPVLPSKPTSSSFVPSRYRSEPEAMVAVGVICAPTQEEAEYLASSVRLLQWRIRQGDRSPVASPEDAQRELTAAGKSLARETGEWPRYFVGTPAEGEGRPRTDG